MASICLIALGMQLKKNFFNNIRRMCNLIKKFGKMLQLISLPISSKIPRKLLECHKVIKLFILQVLRCSSPSGVNLLIGKNATA